MHRLMVAIIVFVVCVSSRSALAAEPANPPDASVPVDPVDLAALDSDIAKADAAAAKHDWDAALKFVDYTGHEEEAFAKAMLRYGASQAAVRKTVFDKFGAPAWKHAARAMRLSEGSRSDKPKHTGRVVDGVLFAKTEGAETEVPYVKIEGVWKLSVRDVIFKSLKGMKKDGKDQEIEEATVFAVAGKIAKVLDGKSDSIDALAADVRDGKIASLEAFKAASAERFPAAAPKKPAGSSDAAKPKR